MAWESLLGDAALSSPGSPHGNMALRLAIISLCVTGSLAVTGVDVSQHVSDSTWSCLRQPGGEGPIEFAIVRVYQSGGHLDPHGAATIKAARAAGVAYVDGYIFPCYSCGDPAGQVKATVTGLRSAGAEFGMLWLDIERYHWSTDLTANQQFIKEMVDEGTALGIRAGVYSSLYSWEAIVGASWSYASDAGLPLWYAHYDGVPRFSDFKPFGGWMKPAIKQYLGDKTSCGAGVDYNFYPSSSTALLFQPPLNGVPTPAPAMLNNSTSALATGNASSPRSSCGWVAYKQCDARWAQEALGTSTTNTICKAGCAMSSVAMYVATRGHGGMTPGSLNRWLLSHGGYASKDLIVYAAGTRTEPV